MKVSWKNDWPAALLVLAAAILIVPLWTVRSPGMPDYPAHIAGFFLVAHPTPYYSVHWVLVPNLASEMAVPVLAKLFALETATKLFLSLAVAMWVLGPGAIQRALTGRIGVTSLAGALFAYNANFTWGFFNYYFSAGLCFVIFAAWIVAAKRRGPLTLATFAAAVVVLYACHLFAVCILVTLIACFEASRALDERLTDLKTLARRAAESAAVFVPAAIVYVAVHPAGGAGDLEFNYADTIGDRLASAIQVNFSDPAYLMIGGLAILVLAGLIYRRIRVHRLAKILVLVLATLTVAAPEWAMGGWGVDLRLPAVLEAVLFAGMEVRLGARFMKGLAALLLAAAAANAAQLADAWRGYDRQYGEFRDAIRSLPRGVRLLTVLDGDALGDTADPPYWHMAEFAIVDKGAFTPLMFATKGQHIVRVNPPYDRWAAASAQQGSPPDVTELTDLSIGRDDEDTDIKDVFPYLKHFQCHYDVAVVISGNSEESTVPPFMELRHSGSFFSLYDIHPTHACVRR
ncbi:MAG: hypothetical protein KGJ78_04270 [Alphaproteobacteria bacterium]|nr:hypothetical protein [Alphaproteobacteria bacterium]